MAVTIVQEPQRVQRLRQRGWRMPENTVSVCRPGKWGNPFAFQTRNALARVPALDGSPWEYETRISANGMRHDCHHPDGRITVHHIRYMTIDECVDLYRQALTSPTPQVHLSWRPDHNKAARWLSVDDAIADLGGKNLACYCKPLAPCHADVLLDLANPKTRTHG